MQIDTFIEKGFPFHKLLGVKVDKIGEDSVRLYIPFKDDLIGHAESAMIHGGVIQRLLIYVEDSPFGHAATRMTLSPR